jgi:hypothetical protein
MLGLFQVALNGDAIMTQKPLEPAKIKSILKNIREGMEVHDSQEHKVGTVKEVYFGADSDEMMSHGAGAATAPNPGVGNDNLVTDVTRAVFTGYDNLPEEMRQRLLNEGFIRISATLHSDRYALPEQISRVHEDHVHLAVAFDDLLKVP